MAPIFSKRFQALARNGAKSRVIKGAIHNEDMVKRANEEMRPKGDVFTVKLTEKSPTEHYATIDHKEVWMNTQKEKKCHFNPRYGRMTRAYYGFSKIISRWLGMPHGQPPFASNDAALVRDPKTFTRQPRIQKTCKSA